MVEELLCVWCAFILLGGVESRVVWDYTKYVAPCHGIYVFLL